MKISGFQKPMHKMGLNDPTVAVGNGVIWFGVNVQKHMLGPDFMRQLAKQEPLVIRDLRLQVEWIARGKYPILIPPAPGPMSDFLRAGAPISTLTPAEGTYLVGSQGAVAMYNQAPHPKAAQAFVNWFLGKEAQTLHSRLNFTDSARLDINTDFLPPDTKRRPDVKYFNTEAEEFILERTKQAELAKEIFGHLVK